MQCNPCRVVKCIPIECSGFHAAWLNAVYSMQREEMEPNWMQGFYAALLNAVDSKSKIECSGFYAAWPKASRLNAVDSMHCDWMQWTPCSKVECIPIECRGFHAAWLNAVYSMQREEMEPNWMQGFMQHYWMQWIQKARLNAVDFMQYGPKHPYRTQWIPCILSVWNVIHAAL